MGQNKLIGLIVSMLFITTVKAEERISVSLIEPEKFFDVYEGGYSKQRSIKIFEKDIKRLFNSLEKRYLKAGHRLAVQIIDVDLAGSIDASVSPGDARRIIRPATPVRLKFKYDLLDEQSKVLKSGTEYLNGKVSKSNIISHKRRLFHEAKLLKKWLATLYS